MSDNPPAMLTKTHAASLLGVSTTTLNQMIDDGLIDTVTLVNRRYVTRASVSELMSHTSNPRNLNTVLKGIERRLDHLTFLLEEMATTQGQRTTEVPA